MEIDETFDEDPEINSGRTVAFRRKSHMKIIAWTIFSYECNHLHFR